MGKGPTLRHWRQGPRPSSLHTRVFVEGLLLCSCTLHSLCLIFISLTLPKYECLVDRNADNNEPEDLIQKTFFGELQRVIQFDLPQSVDIHHPQNETILLAHIKTCNATEREGNLWDYSTIRPSPHFVDLKAVSCVVGRVFDRERWTFIDRSGPTADAKMASPPSSSECSDVTDFSTSDESDSDPGADLDDALSLDVSSVDLNGSPMDLDESSAGSSE